MRAIVFRYSCVLAALLITCNAANGASIGVTLVDVKLGSLPGTRTGVLSQSLTGTYDTVTEIVTMDPGTTSIKMEILPFPSYHLFTHIHENWSTGGGSYAALSYECVEGSFGFVLGGSLCGGYSWGQNSANDSTLDYSTIPGALMLGGDDTAETFIEQGSDYATEMIFYGGPGGSLVMKSADWLANELSETTSDDGIRLEFQVIPIPAAVWLFGSALGLLGWMRPAT